MSDLRQRHPIEPDRDRSHLGPLVAGTHVIGGNVTYVTFGFLRFPIATLSRDAANVSAFAIVFRPGLRRRFAFDSWLGCGTFCVIGVLSNDFDAVDEIFAFFGGHSKPKR